MFLLIGWGSLVTTYQAGMVVRGIAADGIHVGDLFFDPPETWWAVRDVFLGYSHRILAILVGLAAVVSAGLSWRCDCRKPVRLLGAFLVFGIGLQCMLGCFRILGGEVAWARLHAIFAPMLFASSIALVTLASPAWRNRPVPEPDARARRLHWLGLAYLVIVLLQIVLGAQLRHLSLDMSSDRFALWVRLHLLVTGLDLAVVVWLAVLVERRFRARASIRRLARGLLGLVLLQLILGTAAWVTHFGWPAWFSDYVWSFGYTVTAEGRCQVLSTTMHTAAGSLALGAALSLVLWSRRGREE